MSPNTFERRLQIAAQQGQKTLAQIAEALHVSLSSVWRHRKSIGSRQSDPVSQFWSSPAGMRYLIVLFVAVIYCFGLKLGAGAESISDGEYR